MTLYIDTKPTLEWIEYNNRHMAGDYEVGNINGNNAKWYCWYNNQSVNRRYYPTPEAAKAAAQADYEARTAERFRKVVLPPLLRMRRLVKPSDP
jgi:hypothetical protein